MVAWRRAKGEVMGDVSTGIEMKATRQMPWMDGAQLALDTIHRRAVRGTPSWLIHVMDHEHIERLAGASAGDYRRDPHATYLAFQQNVGTCLLDQWIPENPLTMGRAGFEGEQRATTGLSRVVVDGIHIDSPEAVVEHLEGVVSPDLRQQAAHFDEAARCREILAQEQQTQAVLGTGILKGGYGFVRFPTFAYGTYGYEAYFSAYALYPEVMELHFQLQGDVARRNNQAAAKAIVQGQLPPMIRLDHDMADSRGTLVDEKSLDRCWLPYFSRSIEPLLAAGVRLLWHCDGNLMAMVPRLLEAGIAGFQGFQYEDGMDYSKISAMKSNKGEDLIIIAGVSVTTTLPFGTPSDVRDQLRFLVEEGPDVGLFLAGSSTITPGTPFQNIETLVDGLAYYRTR